MNPIRKVLALFGLASGLSGASAPVRQAQAPSGPSLEAGSYRGSIKNYHPARVLGREHRAWERTLGLARVEDLYANDGIARSGVNSIATNVIGAGLRPQSVIAYKMLGLPREAVRDLQERMEWLWEEWCHEAHYREQMHFVDLQMLGLRSLIRAGEVLHMPVMEERPGCRFALRIQDILPSRLRTPWDMQHNPLIHDGVEVSGTGVPVAYWIADPEPSAVVLDEASFGSASFRRVPAHVGHRRGIFHIFRPGREEEFRGVSCLAAALKFFRHLNDAIDYELMAQVLAASFPVFIALEGGATYQPPGLNEEAGGDGEKVYYQNLEFGQIMYGNKGEKPEVLESKRPSQNFLSFCDLILRITASSLEIPYEELTKDFSKTTYSSEGEAVKTYSVDFKRPASHNVVLSGDAFWTSPASSLILSVESAGALIQEDTGGLAPTDLILGKNCLMPFLRHQDVKDNLDNRRVEIGQMSPRVLAKLKGVWNGLNIWYDASSYVDVEGESKYYLDPNCALLLARDAESVIEYGLPVDIKCQGPTAIFSKSFEQDDPSGVFTIAESRPLPVTRHVGWTVKIRALAA
ncbi:MAG: phage portal protein [Desulfovibrio sp.]|jgi:lambda family phage portal protein|nr:phage portal protein [Desulfovibrio sp.]